MEADEKSRFVKIKAARGYGDDIFYVQGYNSASDEFALQRLLKDGGGTTGCINMYRAHCYIDRDTIKASQRQRSAAAKPSALNRFVGRHSRTKGNK